jgi:hypothetical protein
VKAVFGRLILFSNFGESAKEFNLGCQRRAFLRLRVSSRLPSPVFIANLPNFFTHRSPSVRQAVGKTVAGFSYEGSNPFRCTKTISNFCERNSKRLSVGLPNRMLRVRIPSLTPILLLSREEKRDFFNPHFSHIFSAP